MAGESSRKRGAAGAAGTTGSTGATSKTDVRSSRGVTRGLVLPVLLLIVIVVVAALAFRSYRDYLDELIYQERLNQMTEVTEELYSSMDMLMSGEWGKAQFIKNGVEREGLKTTGELMEYLCELQDIYEAGQDALAPIAVDEAGRYYAASGKKGVVYNIEELVDCEDRICSVTNIFGTDATEVLFLYKLDEPLVLEDATILFAGHIEGFSVIIDRYHTDAFGGQSVAYLLSDNGIKLYATDAQDPDQVFAGRNVFSILEDMAYTHGNSYGACMRALEEKGNAVANASLNGTEYYLCLHRMADADWVFLLAIPAGCVATNTQLLIDSAVRTLLFSGAALTVITVLILIVAMRMRQQGQLYRKEQENSAKLEVSRQEAEAARHAAEEAFKVANAANSSKSAFLNNMSHDIRTPMNAIVGFSDLLERDADDPQKVREYTRKIKSSGQHLLGLINDVLDMSKIEAGKVNLNLSDEKIADIIEGAETIIRPQMQEKGHSFEVVARDVRHQDVVVDKLRLNQILLNLLSNACKYTPDGGRIVLTVRELPPRRCGYAVYRFAVQDNGCGMSQEFAATIFDTFTREENSVTNKIQGTGLGMAITKSLVKLMGGQITVQTRKGEGSTFTVDLELHLSDDAGEAAHGDGGAPVAEGAQDEPGARDPEGVPGVLGGLHFLAAEDNDLNAEILVELLKTAGATVDVYANGQLVVEAFEKSAPGQYAAVLMDVQMPVMNGLEAARAIRSCAHPLAASIPIIAMTANAFAEDIHDCLEAGMNAHVPKPVDMGVFERAVRDVLDAGADAEAAE